MINNDKELFTISIGVNITICKNIMSFHKIYAEITEQILFIGSFLSQIKKVYCKKCENYPFLSFFRCVEFLSCVLGQLKLRCLDDNLQYSKSPAKLFLAFLLHSEQHVIPGFTLGQIQRIKLFTTFVPHHEQ